LVSLARAPYGQALAASATGDILSRTRDTHHAQGCSCTSVSTRRMNASNSSDEWKRATWPETRCSTRPSQDSGASVGWARN
jgi:hypothetical protein